jgi:hypothetical protein
MSQRAFNHDFGSAQRISAMDQVNDRPESCQISGLFARAVPTAYNDQRLVPKHWQRAVTGCTISDSLVFEFQFAFQPRCR